MLGFLALLAFLPVLATVVLMASFNWPAKKAMPVVWLGAVGLGLLVWRMGARARSSRDNRRGTKCLQSLDYCLWSYSFT